MRLVIIGFALLMLFHQTAAAEQFKKGEELYKEHCALCHGADGRKGQGYDTPIWGPGTQIQKYATSKGLFEYIQLLMPFDDPLKVNDEQKWAILQYMLANHGAISRDQKTDLKAEDIQIK